MYSQYWVLTTLKVPTTQRSLTALEVHKVLKVLTAPEAQKSSHSQNCDYSQCSKYTAPPSAGILMRGTRNTTGTCTHLASSSRAMTAAARGADADVPVCLVVHVSFRSVVVYIHTQNKDVRQETKPPPPGSGKSSAVSLITTRPPPKSKH